MWRPLWYGLVLWAADVSWWFRSLRLRWTHKRWTSGVWTCERCGMPLLYTGDRIVDVLESYWESGNVKRRRHHCGVRR